MQPFVHVSGIAAALPAANIDTDVIMPKQFLKGVDRNGLKQGLFHDLRFDGQGRERPEFVLNQPAQRDATFLVTGPNFGCGSSREHAVWGLMQYGIRALIGTTFAGIFFDNCARNGLLALTLEDAQLAQVLQTVTTHGSAALHIDLEAQTLTGSGLAIRFDIDPVRRHALLQGLDAIGQTLSQRADILAFEARHHAQSPWLC